MSPFASITRWHWYVESHWISFVSAVHWACCSVWTSGRWSIRQLHAPRHWHSHPHYPRHKKWSKGRKSKAVPYFCLSSILLSCLEQRIWFTLFDSPGRWREKILLSWQLFLMSHSLSNLFSEKLRLIRKKSFPLPASNYKQNSRTDSWFYRPSQRKWCPYKHTRRPLVRGPMYNPSEHFNELIMKDFRNCRDAANNCVNIAEHIGLVPNSIASESDTYFIYKVFSTLES